MFLREPTDGHMVRMTGFGLYCAQYSTFSAKINDLRPIPDLYGDLSVISPSTGLNQQALFGSDRGWIRSGADLTGFFGSAWDPRISRRNRVPWKNISRTCLRRPRIPLRPAAGPSSG